MPPKRAPIVWSEGGDGDRKDGERSSLHRTSTSKSESPYQKEKVKTESTPLKSSRRKTRSPADESKAKSTLKFEGKTEAPHRRSKSPRSKPTSSAHSRIKRRSWSRSPKRELKREQVLEPEPKRERDLEQKPERKGRKARLQRASMSPPRRSSGSPPRRRRRPSGGDPKRERAATRSRSPSPARRRRRRSESPPAPWKRRAWTARPVVTLSAHDEASWLTKPPMYELGPSNQTSAPGCGALTWPLLVDPAAAFFVHADADWFAALNPAFFRPPCRGPPPPRRRERTPDCERGESDPFRRKGQRRRRRTPSGGGSGSDEQAATLDTNARERATDSRTQERERERRPAANRGEREQSRPPTPPLPSLPGSPARLPSPPSDCALPAVVDDAAQMNAAGRTAAEIEALLEARLPRLARNQRPDDAWIDAALQVMVELKGGGAEPSYNRLPRHQPPAQPAEAPDWSDEERRRQRMAQQKWDLLMGEIGANGSPAHSSTSAGGRTPDERARRSSVEADRRRRESAERERVRRKRRDDRERERRDDERRERRRSPPGRERDKKRRRTRSRDRPHASASTSTSTGRTDREREREAAERRLRVSRTERPAAAEARAERPPSIEKENEKQRAVDELQPRAATKERPVEEPQTTKRPADVPRAKDPRTERSSKDPRLSKDARAETRCAESTGPRLLATYAEEQLTERQVERPAEGPTEKPRAAEPPVQAKYPSGWSKPNDLPPLVDCRRTRDLRTVPLIVEPRQAAAQVPPDVPLQPRRAVSHASSPEDGELLTDGASTPAVERDDAAAPLAPVPISDVSDGGEQSDDDIIFVEVVTKSTVPVGQTNSEIKQEASEAEDVHPTAANSRPLRDVQQTNSKAGVAAARAEEPPTSTEAEAEEPEQRKKAEKQAELDESKRTEAHVERQRERLDESEAPHRSGHVEQLQTRAERPKEAADRQEITSEKEAEEPQPSTSEAPAAIPAHLRDVYEHFRDKMPSTVVRKAPQTAASSPPPSVGDDDDVSSVGSSVLLDLSDASESEDDEDEQPTTSEATAGAPPTSSEPASAPKEQVDSTTRAGKRAGVRAQIPAQSNANSALRVEGQPTERAEKRGDSKERSDGTKATADVTSRGAEHRPLQEAIVDTTAVTPQTSNVSFKAVDEVAIRATVESWPLAHRPPLAAEQPAGGLPQTTTVMEVLNKHPSVIFYDYDALKLIHLNLPIYHFTIHASCKLLLLRVHPNDHPPGLDGYRLVCRMEMPRFERRLEESRDSYVLGFTKDAPNSTLVQRFLDDINENILFDELVGECLAALECPVLVLIPPANHKQLEEFRLDSRRFTVM